MPSAKQAFFRAVAAQWPDDHHYPHDSDEMTRKT
jgi:hypothetical protein